MDDWNKPISLIICMNINFSNDSPENSFWKWLKNSSYIVIKSLKEFIPKDLKKCIYWNLPAVSATPSLNHSILISGSPIGISLHSKWAGEASFRWTCCLIWVLKTGGRATSLLNISSSVGSGSSPLLINSRVVGRAGGSLESNNIDGEVFNR